MALAFTWLVGARLIVFGGRPKTICEVTTSPLTAPQQ
jgi:hypothetical protein